MIALTDLIARLEAATEGSRELDAAIAVETFKRVSTADDLIYALETRSYDDCAPGTYWRKSRSGASLHTAPAYTTSLDAALTLAINLWNAVVMLGAAYMAANKSVSSENVHKPHDDNWPIIRAMLLETMRARQAEEG